MPPSRCAFLVLGRSSEGADNRQRYHGRCETREHSSVGDDSKWQGASFEMLYRVDSTSTPERQDERCEYRFSAMNEVTLHLFWAGQLEKKYGRYEPLIGVYLVLRMPRSAAIAPSGRNCCRAANTPCCSRWMALKVNGSNKVLAAYEAR